MRNGKIIKVSGPLVVAEEMSGSKMNDVVFVGDKKLVGEIIELKGGTASIQVYEETAGIGPGEVVIPTGRPLSVELGPGLIESIFDGIQRPLDRIREISGDYIPRGVEVFSLDREKKWNFVPVMKDGESVLPGDIIGIVHETDLVEHRIMVPAGISGIIDKIKSGSFLITDTVCTINGKGKLTEITMLRVWPVRIPRNYIEKLPPVDMFITGQRVIDTLFPMVKGGTACIPGPFGSGKTVVQHQLAKWADAEIVIYVGCGERGNEMTDVLQEFPKLIDPGSGKPLMKRTVLIANTSNMPVAAREASVYTGITIAEYFRDMGYSVALMADSTSRWAEAMREISGRLEEMPGEEGYPAYLSSKVSAFYERAGRVVCLGKDKRIGTLSVVGAVSPPGGDLSDPVVQSTLRVVKVFWSLEDKLAFQRHFPAISWLRSYSLYDQVVDDYLEKNVDPAFPVLRNKIIHILGKEAELEEIVRLVGVESLSGSDRLIMKTAEIFKQDFLHQNAFSETDTHTTVYKQFLILDLILYLHRKLQDEIDKNTPFYLFEKLKVEEKITRAKEIAEERVVMISDIKNEIDSEISKKISER